ncbi:hypothetical protein Droror1_Dr00011882 [Drosera rotundifolia]
MFQTHLSTNPRLLYHRTPELYHQLNQILQQCNLFDDPRPLKSAHCVLLMGMFDGYVSVWNKLLRCYVERGWFGYARNVFDEMSERDVVSYNTMISGNIREGNVGEAVRVYGLMRKGDVWPNYITLASLVGVLSLGGVVHGHAIRCGWSGNRFFGSSLVDMYSKRGRLDCAIKAFEEIRELDLVSWNIVIDGCASNRSNGEALRLFVEMMNRDFSFDGFTLTSVMKTCLEPRDLYHGRLLHGIATKAGFSFETPLNNSLITMYSKCEKGMTSAEKIFLGTPEPNVISWTAMIAGYMQNEQNVNAIRFYRRMLEMGVQENEFSLASVLPAFSNLAELDQGRQIHARVIKSRFKSDLTVNNALVDLYSQCGSLADAHTVFLSMERHDVVSYTAMIGSFGKHGRGREALDILNRMISRRLVPDDVAFLGCLSACSHCGLLDEGTRVLQMMINVYRHRPKREHISCVVNMFGRAGKLREAEKFICDMGMESDLVVWETLLGACMVHGDMELGEKSARRVMELQPERHGPYVALANMYADRELWNDKETLREHLSPNRTDREVGYSRIT